MPRMEGEIPQAHALTGIAPVLRRLSVSGTHSFEMTNTLLLSRWTRELSFRRAERRKPLNLRQLRIPRGAIPRAGASNRDPSCHNALSFRADSVCLAPAAEKSLRRRTAHSYAILRLLVREKTLRDSSVPQATGNQVHGMNHSLGQGKHRVRVSHFKTKGRPLNSIRVAPYQGGRGSKTISALLYFLKPFRMEGLNFFVPLLRENQVPVIARAVGRLFDTCPDPSARLPPPAGSGTRPGSPAGWLAGAAPPPSA